MTKVSSEHMTSGVSAVLTLPCSSRAPNRSEMTALYSPLLESNISVSSISVKQKLEKQRPVMTPISKLNCARMELSVCACYNSEMLDDVSGINEDDKVILSKGASGFSWSAFL